MVRNIWFEMQKKQTKKTKKKTKKNKQTKKNTEKACFFFELVDLKQEKHVYRLSQAVWNKKTSSLARHR